MKSSVPGIIDRHGRLRNLTPTGKALRAVLSSREAKAGVARFAVECGRRSPNPYRNGACSVAAEAIAAWIQRTCPGRKVSVTRYSIRLEGHTDFHDACRTGDTVLDANGIFHPETIAEAIESIENNAGEACEVSYRTVRAGARKSRDYSGAWVVWLSDLIERHIGPYIPEDAGATQPRKSQKGKEGKA